MAKRTNTKAKGNAIEKAAQAILERDGYWVERARPVIVWLGPRRPISTAHDYWGKIDLIALHPIKQARLIQCSVPGELSRKRKLLDGWLPHGVSVEVWIWHGGRGRHFDIFTPDDRFTRSTGRAEPMG